jgi:integrase
MATYLHEVAAYRVRPSTFHSYEQFARLYINPWLGRHRLDKLRPQHITTFYREMSKNLAPSSVRRIHAVLRRALTVAVRWGIIHTNPALLVDPPPVPRNDVKPYTVEEARIFLKAALEDRLEARWVIAVSLGLRQGEVLGLGRQHVDLQNGVLRIERALQRQPDGSLKLVETKTHRSKRTIPMPPSVVSGPRTPGRPAGGGAGRGRRCLAGQRPGVHYRVGSPPTAQGSPRVTAHVGQPWPGSSSACRASGPECRGPRARA